MALARAERSSQRFYSMSSQIRAERSAYYEALEHAQRRTTDVTGWMIWFLGCLGRAIDAAGTGLLAKSPGGGRSTSYDLVPEA